MRHVACLVASVRSDGGRPRGTLGRTVRSTRDGTLPHLVNDELVPRGRPEQLRSTFKARQRRLVVREHVQQFLRARWPRLAAPHTDTIDRQEANVSNPSKIDAFSSSGQLSLSAQPHRQGGAPPRLWQSRARAAITGHGSRRRRPPCAAGHGQVTGEAEA